MIFSEEARPGGKILRLRLEWVGPLDLSEPSLQAVPRSLGGVYVIQDHWIDREVFPIAYAGQAADVCARLRAHARGSGNPWVAAARESRPTLFSYAAVRDPALRDAAEAALIWIFQPRFNGQVPRLAPIPITLPPHKE